MIPLKLARASKAAQLRWIRMKERHWPPQPPVVYLSPTSAMAAPAELLEPADTTPMPEANAPAQ